MSKSVQDIIKGAQANTRAGFISQQLKIAKSLAHTISGEDIERYVDQHIQASKVGRWVFKFRAPTPLQKFQMLIEQAGTLYNELDRVGALHRLAAAWKVYLTRHDDKPALGSVLNMAAE